MSRNTNREDELKMMTFLETMYLKKNFENYKIIHGSEPPDFFIEIGEKHVALEMSQLFVKVDDNEILTDSFQFEAPIFEHIKYLNKSIGDSVRHYNVRLDISFPIKNFKLVKRNLASEIIKAISETPSPKVKTKLVFGNDYIDLTLSSSPTETGEIVGFIMPNNKSNSIIEENTLIMLREKIFEKNLRMSDLNQNSFTEKWLCLNNNYFLSDFSDYTYAINNLNINHDFTKIFIINYPNKLTDINF